MDVSDVLLVKALPAWGGAKGPLSREVEVAPGIVLAGVVPEMAEQIMAATAFRSPEPERAKAMYGLIRRNPPGDEWDADGEMTKVLFLSHLVKANEAGFEFTARVSISRGKLLRLEPGKIEPPFARAYCSHGARYRWLTQEDADVLRKVVAAYTALRPTLTASRLGHALSMFAEAPFVFHGRPRGLLLTTTLEGLVSTTPDRATKQFVTRVPALAADVGMPRLNAAWAERTYKLRSILAHGSPVLGPVGEQERTKRGDAFQATLTDLDELLRRLIRRGLLDSEFRSRLEELDKHWPVPGKGCPACRSKDSSLIEATCSRCGKPWREQQEISGAVPSRVLKSGDGPSVQIGCVNPNGQRCCGHRGVPGNDHLQLAYKVQCTVCGYVYGANGSDMHDRKCPECQGGKPGIRYWGT